MYRYISLFDDILCVLILPFILPKRLISGDISTEHSASELRVIGTNVYPVDSYFLHLTMPFLNLPLILCSPVGP